MEFDDAPITVPGASESYSHISDALASSSHLASIQAIGVPASSARGIVPPTSNTTDNNGGVIAVSVSLQ